jgi:hypothetical protein
MTPIKYWSLWRPGPSFDKQVWWQTIEERSTNIADLVAVMDKILTEAEDLGLQVRNERMSPQEYYLIVDDGKDKTGPCSCDPEHGYWFLYVELG